MTDATPSEDLVIVPTLAGFIRLHERVEQLERAAPDTVPGDEDTVTTAELVERLTRHRSEIEELKRRWNQLMKYLGAQTGSTQTTTPTPESYQ